MTKAKGAVADNGSIIVYRGKSGAVELRHDISSSTVWATQAQIARIFGVNPQAITKHIKNIYADNELSGRSTCSKMEQVRLEGNRKVRRTLETYNLDLIIAVGYRINSVLGTKFRRWATSVIRKHLVDGYTLNEKRLREQSAKFLELRRSIDLLGNLAALESVNGETRGVVQIIGEYARALDMLDDYDYQRLVIPSGTRREICRITPDSARKVVEEMRRAYGGSPLMGREKDQSLEGALGALYQTFGGKEMYPTVEEKAAHLLYFVTKNHSFIDGNKRIAAALFIWYLAQNRMLDIRPGVRRVSDSTLVALTLLIATSKPEEKDTIIKIVLNLMRPERSS